MHEAMKELVRLLGDNGIAFTVTTCYDGWQIQFDDGSDAICHSGSYGGKMGLWETMGMSGDGDDVTGYLTAQEVVDRYLGY